MNKNNITTDDLKELLKQYRGVSDFSEVYSITTNTSLRRDISQDEIGKRKSITDLCLQEWGDNQESNNEVRELFDTKEYFDYTKPTQLIKNLTKSIFTENEIIMDFFAGSGTTAYAVMDLNVEDDGNRKCISIQLPESINNNKPAAKKNLKSLNKPAKISELAKLRIQRAADLIKDKFPNTNVDIGLKVFKLDGTNLKTWDPNP